MKLSRFLMILLLMVSNLGFAQLCNSLKIKDVLGNEQINVSCNYPLVNSNCVTLTADYPKIYETTSYNVSSLAYSPTIPFNQGTAVNANFDDIFTNVINLPFNFCFFGNSFNSLVIGSNGLISFNTEYANSISYPNITATNPDSVLPNNSIFGAMQDLVFSNANNSEIYYSVVGTAPCRKFVINFYEGTIAGCNQQSTSQIVLHETTNIIDVIVNKKPLPCSTAKFHESLIGISNSDGSEGFSPPNRNTGIWEANQESWRFSPNGNEIVPTITWYNPNTTIIGTGNQVNACFTSNNSETVTAEAVYESCNGNTVTLTDNITVNYAADFPLVKNYTHIFCGNAGQPQSVNLDDFKANLTSQNITNFNFTYHLTAAEAQTGANPQPVNTVISANTTYYVRVTNTTDFNCYRVAKLELKFISNTLLTNIVNVCDSNNNGFENNFVLSRLNQQLFGTAFTGTVRYYLSQANANNNTGAVNTANITSTTQLWVRITTENCFKVFGPITINFIVAPQVVASPFIFSNTICDINNNLVEPFDWEEIVGPMITSDPDVFQITFHNTLSQANAGNPKVTVIKEGVYKIWARVMYEGGCYSIVEIDVNNVFEKIEVEPKNVFICFNGTEDVPVNLTTLAEGMLIAPLDQNLTPQFFLNNGVANNPTNTTVLPLNPNQLLVKNGNFVKYVFYTRYLKNDSCFTVKPLTVTLVHPINRLPNPVKVCDALNDNTQNVNLLNYIPQIRGNQPVAVTFHTDAAATSPVITTFNITPGNATVYVKLVFTDQLSQTVCTEIYPVTFTLQNSPVVTPEITKNISNICDNNADNIELYNATLLTPEVFSGNPNLVTFSYYSDVALTTLIPNPAAIPVNGNLTIYIQTKFKTGGCTSVTKVNINYTFLPKIILHEATLNKCDYNFDLNEVFNLNDAIPQLFIPAENSYTLSQLNISYYITETDANAGTVAAQIPSNYLSLTSSDIVYVRFQHNASNCYTVSKIHLKTYLPPKAINSTIKVCDDDFNGTYQLNLMDFTSQMILQQDPANNFTFYYDSALTNPITNATNFTISSLPLQIWVKVENIPGCFDKNYINIVANENLVLNQNNFELNNVCDALNDGIETVNLTQFQSAMTSGAATFTYYTSFTDLQNNANGITNAQNYQFDASSSINTIYVKVEKPQFCPAVAEIHLSLKVIPIFDITDYYICPDSSINIEPDFSGIDAASFLWTLPSGTTFTTSSLQNITADEEGTFTLKITSSNGCSYTDTFEVIVNEVPVINNISYNAGVFTVTATGSGTLLYSADGINWQTSNTFTGLTDYILTFYVKLQDNDCVVSKQFIVEIRINNVFTPNGDGYNDTWEIDGLFTFDGNKTVAKVYDRYGTKVFEQESNTKIIWDGRSFNGRIVNTGTYWYVVITPDGKQKKGWVLIKNRNKD